MGTGVTTMGFRHEFDPANKILLMRFEGRLTDKLLAEAYQATLKYWIATDAHVSIADYSSITEADVSGEFVRQLARDGPIMPDATTRPRFIVVPTEAGFGIGRMFQILGQPKRPLLKVVHTLDEVWADLGITSPHFEPLE